MGSSSYTLFESFRMSNLGFCNWYSLQDIQSRGGSRNFREGFPYQLPLTGGLRLQLPLIL